MPSVIRVSGRCSASAPLLAAGLLPRRLVEEAGSSSVGAAGGHGSVLLRGALPTPVVPRSPTGADGTGLGSREGTRGCVGSGASLQSIGTLGCAASSGRARGVSCAVLHGPRHLQLKKPSFPGLTRDISGIWGSAESWR